METKSVIFARVSTREQEETGYSLDAQIRLLEEYSQRKNIAVIKEFKVWETASLSSQRAKFKEMLAYMEKHDIQVLLCEKVDRLTRNLQDAVGLALCNLSRETETHELGQANKEFPSQEVQNFRR
jgi:DNA invertase Pin-like site-specific DNA recombinase